MDIIGDETELLPEELQAQAVVEIKNILSQVAKALNKPDKETLLALGLKLDALIDAVKEANNLSYRHDIMRDVQGKAEYLVSSPLKVKLRVK